MCIFIYIYIWSFHTHIRTVCVLVGKTCTETQQWLTFDPVCHRARMESERATFRWVISYRRWARRDPDLPCPLSCCVCISFIYTAEIEMISPKANDDDDDETTKNLESSDSRRIGVLFAFRWRHRPRSTKKITPNQVSWHINTYMFILDIAHI